MSHTTSRSWATMLLVASILTACGGDDSASDNSVGDQRTITIESTDTACDVSSVEVPPGDVQFDVKNNGSQVTEFYLYQDDGEHVVAEIENVGPGLTRSLDVSLEPGSYITACKPGMTGDGIRADFVVVDTVTG